MSINRIIMNVIISSLLGIALCLVIKAFVVTKEIQSNTVFVAELDQNIMPSQRITVESLIADLDLVRTKSVELIPANAALETMKQEMPELAYMADNPFRDIVTFRTKGLDAGEIPDFKRVVTDIEGIADVFVDLDMMQTLPDASRRARFGLLIISLIVLIFTLAALALRIKRDLKPYEHDMKILSLAGSSEDHILTNRRTWSTKWGAISAGLAALFMVLNILFINNTLLIGIEITFLQSIMAIIGMMILVIGVHTIVTHRTIKSYLSQLNPSIKL